MIADMHRARQLAWELPSLGWDVEVLAPNASYQLSSCVDDDSAEFFSPGGVIHFVPQRWSSLFERVGLRSIGWRAIIPMLHEGNKLFGDGDFDLIYFSTTQFPLFLLGPLWKRRFGVPFVLDFHDPCYRQGPPAPVWARPSIKHLISRWISKYVESYATIGASGLIAVSPNYIDVLRRRYLHARPDWLDPRRNAVIPFGALPFDLDEVTSRLTSRDQTNEPKARIVYVGAGGPIMLRSFSFLCSVLSYLRQRLPELLEGISIELYGTLLGWRTGDQKHLIELARSQKLADVVREYPGRVSYRRSLELLVGSDGALILGVDDVGYMPSKLFTYALSGKPLLAAVREEGPAFAQFRRNPELGHALWFRESETMQLADAAVVVTAFLRDVIARRNSDRRAMLESFLARRMAECHADLFEASLSIPTPRSKLGRTSLDT
jgi:glycosyltransferase involved in cell wall biosynthesis